MSKLLCFLVPVLVLPGYSKVLEADEIEPTEIFIFAPHRSEDQHPYTFKNVRADSFALRQYGQEPSYLLSTTPAVTAYSDSGSNQGYSYFRIRGIDQTRINMTLDGVPLNEPEDQGVYFSNYPDFFSAIDGFQLVRGVGSSQNGSASYGGSIRFTSHDLNQPRYAKLGVGGGAFGSYRTFAEYNSGLENGQGVYLRAADIHSDGYKHHSGNTSQSLFFKGAMYRGSDDWVVSGFVGRQENNLAWIGATREQIIADRRSNANAPSEDDQFLQTQLQLQNVHTFDSNAALSSNIYYGHLVGNYDFDLNNFLSLPPDETLFNYDFGSDFLGAFSSYKIAFDTTRITTGVHGNIYERQHRGSERTIGDLYTNTGHKKEASAFAQLEQDFDDFVFLGDIQARYTRFDYTGDVDLESLDWTFMNPKAGMTYRLSNYSDLYYSIGRTGREPTRNDIFAGSDNLLADQQGNPIIGTDSAEFVTDHELGIRSKGDSWKMQVNGYYMNFDDEIVLKGQLGPNGLPLTQSVNESYRSGIEFDIDWSIADCITLTSNMALDRSRIDAAGEEFSPVITPQFLANQGIRYVAGNFSFDTNIHLQSSSYLDLANSSKLNDYYVVDLGAQYQFDNLLINFQLNNLFDRNYFSNGYIDGFGESRFFVQAPTNTYLTLTWKL